MTTRRVMRSLAQLRISRLKSGWLLLRVPLSVMVTWYIVTSLTVLFVSMMETWRRSHAANGYGVRVTARHHMGSWVMMRPCTASLPTTGRASHKDDRNIRHQRELYKCFALGCVPPRDAVDFEWTFDGFVSSVWRVVVIVLSINCRGILRVCRSSLTVSAFHRHLWLSCGPSHEYVACQGAKHGAF